MSEAAPVVGLGRFRGVLTILTAGGSGASKSSKRRHGDVLKILTRSGLRLAILALGVDYRASMSHVGAHCHCVAPAGGGGSGHSRAAPHMCVAMCVYI